MGPSNARATTRTHELPVTIHKVLGRKVGLDIDYKPGEKDIAILGIAPGSLAEQACAHIQPGDRIVEVNGAKNDSERMLERIKKDETLDIIIIPSSQVDG